jgi:perosamine synthetase
MIKSIYYTKPSITELELAYASDAVKNGWGNRCYEYIDKFEKSFRDHIGTKYSIATSSATGALHIGMAALDIGEGDEVILANTNWVASVAPILYLGAKPILVDIDETSWCLSIKEVKKAITTKTKAIMAVHLYGNVCEMDELIAICKKHRIHLIEDSAEAIGSEYKGKKAGSIGTFGVFSFHGTKTMTTGEGGMFVTNDDKLYDKVLTLSNHGRSKYQKKQFWPDVLGYKYKISNVQAAIGLAQTERLNELIERKREIFNFYQKELNNIDGVSLNPIVSNCKSGFWMVNVVFSSYLGITREQLINSFNKENIDARVFFWPLSSLDFIDVEVNTPIAYDLPSRSINIPSFHEITFEEQNRVIEVIKRQINSN